MATLNEYDIGDLIVLSVAFKNLAGQATNPTTVTCEVCDPAGKITTPSASNTGTTGSYSAEVDLTNATPGFYTYAFIGTGACQAVEAGQFYVRKSVFK